MGGIINVDDAAADGDLPFTQMTTGKVPYLKFAREGNWMSGTDLPQISGVRLAALRSPGVRQIMRQTD
jgi:hypothetical protein